MPGRRADLGPATEIVRRCERRVGELVRKGQEEGTILTKGQQMSRVDPLRIGEVRRPHEAMGIGVNDHVAQSDAYAFAAAPAEDFDAAIEEARAEGNLSRAKVVSLFLDRGPLRYPSTATADPPKLRCPVLRVGRCAVNLPGAAEKAPGPGTPLAALLVMGHDGPP
jgi:hypothetical protein